jgi:hypothetical protein
MYHLMNYEFVQVRLTYEQVFFAEHLAKVAQIYLAITTHAPL